MGHVRWRPVALATLLVIAVVLLAAAGLANQPVKRATAELEEARAWLKGAVVVVDPGHGGGDPGAVVQGTREKDLVLPIGLTVKELLEGHGAKVVLTRERDEGLGGPIREDLGRRVAVIRQHQAQLFVSIHANTDQCRCWGAQTFYQKDGQPEARDLARSIQAQLRRLTPTTREALAANYFVLRNAGVPATVVEVGFLTDAKEHARLKDKEYQRTLALAIAVGISDHFRQYPPPAQPEPPSQTPPRAKPWWRLWP